MPMSARGRPYHHSATEQASQLRERLRDRTAVAEHLQHAEEIIDNLVFGVEYTPEMLWRCQGPEGNTRACAFRPPPGM